MSWRWDLDLIILRLEFIRFIPLDEKFWDEAFRIYLELLGLPEVLFITTNDLSGMAFCPNKAYITVNYLGGITEYGLRHGEYDNNIAYDNFKRKVKRKLTKEELMEFIKNELFSLAVLYNGVKILRYSWFDESFGSLIDESLMEKGIFASVFRVNFAIPPFFLSGVPDVVIIEDRKVKGVIEIKSSRNVSGLIHTYEHNQVEFYKLYLIKRQFPLHENAYFLTLKKESAALSKERRE